MAPTWEKEYCSADLGNAIRSLITGENSACIGKTYRAISKTFEYYNDLEAFPRCHFADPSDAGRL